MSNTVPQAEGVTLLEGEEVLHNLRPSWWRWPKLTILGILGTLVIIGSPILVYVYLKRKKTRYIVTNQRVIEKTGLFSTHTNEYRMDKIRQLQTGASWIEKRYGHGSITFAAGAGGDLITFSGVPNYQTVANTIREQQRE